MGDLLSTIIALAIIFPFAIWFAKVADRASMPKKYKQKVKKGKKPEPKHPALKTTFRILLFIGFALLYVYCYGMQGFMSFSPELWPLPLFLISALIILCSSGWLQYGLVIALAVLAILIDSGAFLVPASDGYHHTSVMSIILIPFWMICIAMNNVSIDEDIYKEESFEKSLKK